MKNKTWLNLFLILAGVVFGSMVAHFTKDVSAMNWLAYGLNFGTASPVQVNLGVVNFTLGISFNLSVATILCIAICLIVGKYLFRK